MASGRLRVAVIGAGGAGLCSARHILSSPLTFEPPVVFEMTGQVGGTWVYTGEVDNGTHIHSSMYRDLKTNLPKEIMEFPDFAFDPSLPSFIHHSEVLKYLEDYTDKFSIRPHIRFNTPVVSVTPVLEEGKNTEVSWDVTSQTQDDGDPVTETFDAIMVCVGHYSHPYVPDIEGMEKFQVLDTYCCCLTISITFKNDLSPVSWALGFPLSEKSSICSHNLGTLEEDENEECKEPGVNTEDFQNSNSSKRCRKRTSFNKSQSTFLLNEFDRNPYPDFTKRCRMAKRTGIAEPRIQVWFQNRRARHLLKKSPNEQDIQFSTSGDFPNIFSKELQKLQIDGFF